MTSRIDVIVGGQYGSESKGRVTAEIAALRKSQGHAVIGVRVAGPNAGHVVIDRNGQRFALRQIPVAMVVDPVAVGLIAAGSEIDPDVLHAEIEDLERGGHLIRHRLLIDEQATILTPEHRDREGGNEGGIQKRIGSTGKGIGAARADRVMRVAPIVRNEDWRGLVSDYGHICNTQEYLHSALTADCGYAVVIEGTQGYALGLHAGHYPFATSSDCRAIDFLAMAGISPWGYRTALLHVHVVLRAYPIRVAGNSGPMLAETSWNELGLPAEHTTVTKKVRRVGQWDPALAAAAVQANGGTFCEAHLAMADQRIEGLRGHTQVESLDEASRVALFVWVNRIEREIGTKIASVGTGPSSTIWTAAWRAEIDASWTAEEVADVSRLVVGVSGVRES